MKTIRFAGSLILAVAVLYAASLTPTAAQDNATFTGVTACNRAIKLLDEGKPAEALELLEQAEKTIPEEDLWLWWGNKGLCYRDLRQGEDAIEAFSKAIELNPDGWFRIKRAALLHQYGRWDEALADLDADAEREAPDAYARELRLVIDGPFKQRWPQAYEKLQMTSQLGNYQIVSDFGITDEEMDELEKRAAEYDPEVRRDAKRLKKLLKPTDELELLGKLMEHVRQKYMDFIGMKEKDWPKGKVIKVFFFRDKQGFHDFAERTGSRKSEHTAGFYDPNHHYLQLFAGTDDDRLYGIDRESIDTLIHEGWHQFFHAMTDTRPIWLDEGLAEFLGHCEPRKGGTELELGMLIRARGDYWTRYQRIRETVREGNHVPFTEFFRYSSDDWHASDTRISYAQAWSIAYYALRGKNKQFQKAYIKFFWGCVNGEDVDELREEHFPDEDLEEYEKDWVKYIEKL